MYVCLSTYLPTYLPVSYLGQKGQNEGEDEGEWLEKDLEQDKIWWPKLRLESLLEPDHHPYCCYYCPPPAMEPDIGIIIMRRAGGRKGRKGKATQALPDEVVMASVIIFQEIQVSQLLILVFVLCLWQMMETHIISLVKRDDSIPFHYSLPLPSNSWFTDAVERCFAIMSNPANLLSSDGPCKIKRTGREADMWWIKYLSFLL